MGTREIRHEADGSITAIEPLRGGWVATYRLENPSDPRIVSLVVASGADGVEGELSARMLRSVRPGIVLRDVLASVHSTATWARSWEPDFLVKHPGLKGFADGWGWTFEAKGPTRNDVQVARLLETSARYVAALGRGDRSPVATVAEEMGRKSTQVRDDLHRARTAELLTGGRAPGQRGGRPRGELTEKAIAMLNRELPS